ncbi:MAG TPA: tetratricopeptide repeat protein [Sphingomicrobium sp.]|jgi:cytochrome c-type biogenesis protein CcmH|nr:tetratricopeptide repeat protein [Sphingomicrobium sp.]
MTGWLILALIAASSLGGLALLGVRRALLQLAAAILFAGAAGYALQGRPSLSGAPREASASQAPIPLTRIRHAFFGQFTPAEHWLVISESYARRGNTRNAAGVLRSAIRQHPGDPQLWIGLGNALVEHSGVLTPASQLAYARAMEAAPGHPAAYFFYGLALARSGDREGAVRNWREALASAPADAGWRPLVEDALAALGGDRREGAETP